MNDALYIAATGMQAQQLNVDTIANNLANVNTAGFKRGRVSFTDLMSGASGLVPPGGGADPTTSGPLAPAARVGSGVGISAVSKSFDRGEVKDTGSALDLAIIGDGFLEVSMPDGTRAFTRGGSLTVTADGLLATASGHPLEPRISVPADATGMTIDAKGEVWIQVPGQARPVHAGQLELVRFASPGALLADGNNLYRATEASGEPVAADPGEDGTGTIAQGSLEGSNVKVLEEMVSLIVAQRAYEASVKVVQASDEMLGMINSLRR
jgi:flagellar basal-body rod protein FlgG